jgi:arginyl-tRNA synthetase
MTNQGTATIPLTRLKELEKIESEYQQNLQKELDDLNSSWHKKYAGMEEFYNNELKKCHPIEFNTMQSEYNALKIEYRSLIKSKSDHIKRVQDAEGNLKIAGWTIAILIITLILKFIY